ncbi:MAG: indolepyruvate oxidoreductase subunit beta [Methanobrevibacter sp.]|uniref:indolepyruvate oxidoreductase subunit beta n=1 Tax=Methanobrevibacter sp. TaxID=66852 RepID=UPI0026E085C7|nr:indolepyruvate oxidoreductase subunit beta [Methanobrevibacter sp.]MDO5848870.1 indolepyruvate oxidoreductase subunit beta [Methanobrevibacter sp.]
MAEDNYSMYICGVGGQGIIKTSVIIGEAAMNEGHNVVMSEIHGMSQREGSVSTELKIGDFDSSILPEHSADMILSFEPIELVRALDKANKDTKLVFNTFPLIPSSGDKPYPKIDNLISILKENYNNVLPIEGNQLAIDAGNIVSLNMVLLGAVTADDNFPISKESVIDAMKNNLNPKFHDLNLKAIESGYEWIRG